MNYVADINERFHIRQEQRQEQKEETAYTQKYESLMAMHVSDLLNSLSDEDKAEYENEKKAEIVDFILWSGLDRIVLGEE